MFHQYDVTCSKETDTAYLDEVLSSLEVGILEDKILWPAK
jgi:hypothetical protein